MKNFYKSKTVIFNALSIVVAFLMYYSNSFSGDTKDLILGVVAVINIVLRFNTNTGIKKVV